MSAIDSAGSSWANRTLSILRFVTAFLYFWHGMSKIFGFPTPARASLDLVSLGSASAVLETVGGALLMLGLFTRPVAFVLAGHMAFAYFIGHATKAFWPIANGGELAIMFCFTFLYIFAAGPGPWSLDAAFRRDR